MLFSLTACVDATNSEPTADEAEEEDASPFEEPAEFEAGASEPSTAVRPLEVPRYGEQSAEDLQQRLLRLTAGRSPAELDPAARQEFDAVAYALQWRSGHPQHASQGGQLAVAPATPVAASDSPYFTDYVWSTPIYRATFSLPATASPKVFRTTNLATIIAQPPPPWLFASLLGSPNTMLVVRRGSQTWFNDDCSEGLLESCVTTSTGSGTYTVTVFATNTWSGGFMDLLVDNVQRANDAPFGGSIVPVDVPADGLYAFDTVHTPGGAIDTQAVLFDAAWNERGYDNNSGIGLAAKVTSSVPGPGHRLVVGSTALSTNGSVPQTNVVVNACLSAAHACHLVGNPTSLRGDPDQDSVANALELAMGTDPNDPDTDDDGLFDYVEVIGHRAPTGEELELVSLGTDPRRRDLFVELDHWNGAAPPCGGTLGLAACLEREIMKARDIFFDMSTLPNPNGTAGIQIHVDTGSPCPQDPVTCGDWGGSNMLMLTNAQVATYQGDEAAILPNFARARRGLFHYAFRQSLYTGTSGGLLAWSCRTDNNVGEVLSHELGHGFGIQHGGESLNSRNNKFTYPSIMNYSYQSSLPGFSNERSRFSSGEGDPVDHRWLFELGWEVGNDKSRLAVGPFFYRVEGDWVDFNRDGRQTAEPVMYDDGPVNVQRLGDWPEIMDLRQVTTTDPTGGVGMAIDYTSADQFNARTFLFAPFEHGSEIRVDVTSMTDAVGERREWGPWVPGQSIPGNGLFRGEASAHMFDFSFGRYIVVIYPDASGRLHLSVYNPANDAFGSWVPLPNWPAGATARNSTLAVVNGSLTLVFRDMSRPDDVPNVWLNRLAPNGGWGTWELLTVPSFTTPGVAQGVDGREYLAFVGPLWGPTNRPIFFARRSAGTTNAWEQLSTFQGSSNMWVDAPPQMRTRLTLLFRPYLKFFGTPFEDQSGYLAVFWTAGRPDDRETWRLYRSYLPGFISPTASSFPPQDAGWRAQGQTTRPHWLVSPSVVARHWDVQAVFGGMDWNDNSQMGVWYAPYAGGTPAPTPPEPNDDFDDVSKIAENLCSTIRSLGNDACRCRLGPKASCTGN